MLTYEQRILRLTTQLNVIGKTVMPIIDTAFRWRNRAKKVEAEVARLNALLEEIRAEQVER